MFKRVLLCHDGSPSGRDALKRGTELAINSKARVFVLWVISSAASDAVMTAASCGQFCVVDAESDPRRALRDSISKLTALGVEAHGDLARGNTIDIIADYADRFEADLVVVGHYPTDMGRRWWSGSGRASLAERLNCSVLISRGD